MILFLGNPRRIIPSHSVLRNELLLLLGESERFFVRFTLIIGPTNKTIFLVFVFSPDRSEDCSQKLRTCRNEMTANRVYSYIIKENPTCCCFWWYDNVYTEENTRRKRPQTSTRQCNKKRKKREKIDSTNVNFCRCCAAVVDFFSPLRSWIFIHQANVYMYRWCWNCGEY